MIDPITLSALEYDGLKALLARRLKSALGHEALAALAPAEEAAEVKVTRARAVEGLAYLHEFRAPSPGEVEDPAASLEVLEPEGAVLDPVEIARLTTVIRAAVSYRDEIASVRTRYPRLWDVAGGIPNVKPLLADIAGKISPEGKVEDKASPDLDRIRGRLASLEGRLSKMMRAILDRQPDVIQDAFVTVRSGRFVIPVRVESRRGVAGIIHGASSTGATVFIEPMEAVEANNELVTLRDEEEAEIRKILAALSSRLRANLAELRVMRRLLGEADLVSAAALFARDFACEPAATSDAVSLAGARHPVLQAALESRGGRIVPLDVELQTGGGVVILSGPNTGGKTAALKTIGLLALMNQSGLLVPASRASLPIFAQVLADIGDRQSITDDLSTFSARMLRAGEMSRDLVPPALVLLDEVGAGTDPEEGGALAAAIVDHFRRRGATVVATTHHAALKVYAEMTDGASNASMEFDEAGHVPTYRLLAGIAGRSGGIEMAGRVGLPEEILKDARARVGDAHRQADSYLVRLQELVEGRRAEESRARETREAAEAERAEMADKARAEELRLRASYQEATEAAIGKIGSEAAAIAKETGDRALELQLKAEARKAAKEAEERMRPAVAPPAPKHLTPKDLAAAPGGRGVFATDIPVGATVRIASLGSMATVQAIDTRKGRADVLVRGKRMTIALAECELVSGPAAGPVERRPPVLPTGVTMSSSGRESVGAEVKLIGMRVEEATDLLDKFLDDAVLAGHREVRVIHGHGTGRLRDAVALFLKKHPHVESHHPADAKSGGAGATVAVLKE
ncbi:MAG: Smr/MutS family protein [Acidobacteria bacterium]|nr:Smr/MutS family protein [Acidobacteriota bacterium]